MNNKTVFITGANGGIGVALCEEFSRAGWVVVGSDIHDAAIAPVQQYMQLDLEKFASDEGRGRSVQGELETLIPDSLECLINNAAYQVVSPLGDISSREWRRSLDINVTAPFMLVQMLLPKLKSAQGNVINISSIHTKLTKPNFCAYATSKGALESMTRAMAVELGRDVRVNAISPAAIQTEMLLAGFDGEKELLDVLARCHPTQSIGLPEDIARLAVFIAKQSSSFLNGATIGLDGGIASRLHDPQ